MLGNSPQSRLIAFEPFPGNHPFIDAALGSDPRACVVKKAVADHGRPMKFYVPNVIESGDGRWAGMTGFSAVGYLVADTDPRAATAVTVETCRLDDEVSQRIRFLKIDVQGGEFSVLNGAQQLFDFYGIELVLAEFMGDARIVEFLAKRDYAIYDTLYHSICPVEPLDPAEWMITGVVQSSTGNAILHALPLNAARGSAAEYCRWFSAQRKRYRSLWTDLVAVAPWSQLRSLKS
jgi:FkbM family methyltransferase